MKNVNSILSINFTMERSNMNRMMKQYTVRLLAGVCSLLILTFTAQAVSAQQAAAAQKPVTASAKPAAEEKESALPNSGSKQGIKVHGHWVIDVRNPDGTLAQHHEFENSLVDLGFNLTSLLAGTITIGEPTIDLTNAGYTQTFCGAIYCMLREYTNGGQQRAQGSNCGTTADCVTTLVPTVVTTGTGITTAFALKLTGQITATQAGNIDTVATIFYNCSTSGANTSMVPPSSCASQTTLPANTILSVDPATTGIGPLTQTSITSVPITSGQIVQVSVTLSFS